MLRENLINIFPKFLLKFLQFINFYDFRGVDRQELVHLWGGVHV